MTKIQPFGVDVRGASAEKKREFLELLEKKRNRKFPPNIVCNYYGVQDNDSVSACDGESLAHYFFTRIIPISEGIAILKQALGEEEQPKENDGWISVKDRLPKIGKDYLVTDGQACMVSAFRVEKQAWDFWSLTFWSSDHVTHWMPLPKRPNS